MSNFIVKVQAYYPYIGDPETEHEAISKQELYMADTVEIHTSDNSIALTLISDNREVKCISMPLNSLESTPEKVEKYEIVGMYIENLSGKTLERFHRDYGSPLRI